MRAWTGAEIQEERSRLEQGAATLLGSMLFEYSKLEMDLGLLLVWINDGQDVDSLTRKLSAANFNSKLEFLAKSAQVKFVGKADAQSAYSAWINQAHEIRDVRNQLFHGRWGVNPMAGAVSCVTGLPTSADPHETCYSLADLQSFLNVMRAVRIQLQKIRSEWPL